MLNRLIEAYEGGSSLSQIAASEHKPISRVRRMLLGAGVKMRTQAEGMALARSQGRVRKSPGRRFTPEDIAKAVAARRVKARGWRIASNGYREYTMGEHKGRHEHVVLMEKHLGRPMQKGEQVHHINGDRADNRLENLRVMDAREHVRMHAKKWAPLRNRDGRGRFAEGAIS